jgi:hypothetical protein
MRGGARGRLTAELLLVALVSSASSLVTGSAGAVTTCANGTIVVTTPADSGPGSLRAAFAAATTANGGTICVDPMAVNTPITLTGGTLIYAGTGALTISGNGAAVQGNATFGLVGETSAAPLELDRLTMRGGAVSSGPFPGGGAIDAAGPLVVADSTFSDNRAGAGPSASGVDGGAIRDWNQVTVIQSTFVNNSVHAQEGLDALVGGGAVSAGFFGSLAVEGSTFEQNTASAHVSATDGGAITGGTVNVDGSTFDNNTSFTSALSTQFGRGGAIAGFKISISDSTVTANLANLEGGGIRGEDVSVAYSTVTNNASIRGANLLAGHQLTSFGSLIDHPADVPPPPGAVRAQTAASCAGRFGGPINTVNSDWNSPNDASCGFAGHTAGGDVAALAANGGLTKTMLPSGGLIDAIPILSCRAGNAATVTADQRGISRPQGAGCDIGAVEVAQPAALTAPCGPITIASSAGGIGTPTVAPVPTTPAPPAGVDFPCALIGFSVTGLTPGATVTVDITLPVSARSYWKLQHAAWLQYPGAAINGQEITLTLTDGGAGDADGKADGTIVDPGGPAVPSASMLLAAPNKGVTSSNPAAALNVPPTFTG